MVMEAIMRHLRTKENIPVPEEPGYEFMVEVFPESGEAFIVDEYGRHPIRMEQALSLSREWEALD